MALYTYASDSTATTWYDWNSTYAGTASNVTNTTTAAWVTWNTDYVTTATATDSTVTAWMVWNGQYWQMVAAPQVVQVQEQRTPEELQEQARLAREREEECLRRAAEQRRIAEEAEARAEQLLKANLAPAQLEEFVKDRSFTVISKDGQRRYRVKHGWSHNVERIDDQGKRLHTLCAHPGEQVPQYDNQLTQKLWLEHDEAGFLQIANRGVA